MSPEPYVRGQALALALALLLLALQGPPGAALVCAATVALIAATIRARYGGDLSAAELEDLPSHRLRLDRIVTTDVTTALALGGAAGAFTLVFADGRLDLGIAPISALLLTVTAATILLSSLIDWFVILPRVSGLLGIRPCREPDIDFPRRPTTWREITRWWYIHRIVAAFVLRFGLSLAITFTVSHHIAVPHGSGLVAGAAVGFLASYLAALPAAAWQAGHLSLIVGRTVRRRDVHRVPREIELSDRGLKLPLFSQPIAGELRPREYVYDVALEGVQLVPVARREREVPLDSRGKILYERDPVKLQVKDVDASTPQPAEPFAGCRARCSGISWYCIENSSCFATK